MYCKRGASSIVLKVDRERQRQIERQGQKDPEFQRNAASNNPSVAKKARIRQVVPRPREFDTNAANIGESTAAMACAGISDPTSIVVSSL